MWSTSVPFGVAGAALAAPQSDLTWQVRHPERFAEVRQGVSTMDAYCLAGAVLGAPLSDFAVSFHIIILVLSKLPYLLNPSIYQLDLSNLSNL